VLFFIGVAAMNKSVKCVVSFGQRGELSRAVLALCLCLSPFAQSSFAASDTADSGAAAAPDSGGAPPAGSALQEVLVESQRTTADVARKAQEEAPNLINIQTYSEIRKLPDITTAEAVRRIPGISLETDEGEGRYVNIRGLDADLNSTTFGGLRLPPTNNASPFGGYRAVTLDSIPIGLVGAITVTKSNIPSMDAEALGGTIEITPKTAPTNGAPFIEGDVGGGYETLRRKPLIIFALSGGGRVGGRGAPAGTSTEAYSDHPFSIVASGRASMPGSLRAPSTPRTRRFSTRRADSTCVWRRTTCRPICSGSAPTRPATSTTRSACRWTSAPSTRGTRTGRCTSTPRTC
jgi:hypothetical protein